VCDNRSENRSKKYRENATKIIAKLKSTSTKIMAKRQK
jgi:hypothetical protein